MAVKRVLVIDDEKDFCGLVKMYLEITVTSDLKFNVTTATGGKRGLKLAKRLKPDLILLDITMPDMDGFEVLKRLKEDMDTIAIPVVMISGITDEKAKVRASQLYDEEYITKPVKLPVLKAKIDDIFERMRGE